MKLAKRLILAALALLAALPLAACGGEEAVTLNVLNWGDYIDPALIDQFEEETGIQVKYSTMTSNEEMLVKLAAPDCIYDICVPSDYLIERLIEQDLLHELNKDNIPNLANIDERFLDLSFDPENRYSVPYFWGTVGILYNTTMVDEPVDSWDILWDEKYAGQIIMYDSVRDTIGITLIRLGYDINTRSEEEVLAAQEALIAQEKFFSTEGRHIVCGGTTSTLAAEYLKKPLDTSVPLYLDPDIPPTARIEGVDLVTEGVITFSRVREYADDYLKDNRLYTDWSYKKDGASQIARMLFEEATDVNFFVGRAVNPAHQNPDLPIGFSIKMQLVERVANDLREMGKRITVSYY